MKKSSLTKILIDWERLFNYINHKNNAASVIPWFFTLCERTNFCDIAAKFTEGS